MNFQRSVLDTTVEGQYVDVSVLTKDAYNMSRQLFTTPKTLYQKIAESDQEVSIYMSLCICIFASVSATVQDLLQCSSAYKRTFTL